jgi:hypothetical protein
MVTGGGIISIFVHPEMISFASEEIVSVIVESEN